MNPHTDTLQAGTMRTDHARPVNRRRHHHVSMELRAAERRQRSLTLRQEGRKVREIAREVGVSPSTVNQYIQQALRDSRAASAAMGEHLREQERVRLQAIIDRWQPVATGKYRTKEAARAAEVVRKASASLRALFGLPVDEPGPQVAVAPEPLPSSSAPAEPTPTPTPTPTPEQKLLFLAFDDIALRMARAGLVPQSSYDAAYDALENWQADKYQPANEVSDYLRKNWAKMLAISLD